MVRRLPWSMALLVNSKPTTKDSPVGPLNPVQITREFHGVGRHRHRTLSAINGVVEQGRIAVEFGRPFRQGLGGGKRSRAQGVVQTGGDAVHRNQQAVACLQLTAAVSLDAVKAHDVAGTCMWPKAMTQIPVETMPETAPHTPPIPSSAPLGKVRLDLINESHRTRRITKLRMKGTAKPSPRRTEG